MNTSTQAQQPLLATSHLKKYFPIKSGLLLRTRAHVRAVDDISIAVYPGETYGIVGESGSGKSTLGRTIIRLYEATSGKVHFEGKDFTQHRGAELRAARRSLQMIFQDPFSSLDPRMTVGQILAEPFRVHNLAPARDCDQLAKDLLVSVGLKPSQINRYPHEFSGGQRQRISIARAIALKPKCIIADEPVSALDVSIQAQVLNLMQDLQESMGLTYVFISHDLTVVEHVCDRIAVMYLGRIVEQAEKSELFANPQHPYTRALIHAIPKIGGKKEHARDRVLKGEIPSPINPPSGCSFHPRCPLATERCRQERPTLKAQGSGSEHQVACFHAGSPAAGTA